MTCGGMGSDATVMTGPGLAPVRGLDGFVIDLDGVITRASALYAAAWKRLIDELLAAEAGGRMFKPYDVTVDFRSFFAGQPREDALRGFLERRGLGVEAGVPGDTADRRTLHGLLRRMDVYFQAALAEDGLEIFPSSIEFVELAREQGLKLAAISSGGSALHILEAAGINVNFEVVIGDEDREALGLQGKPDPAFFLEAVRRLGIAPARAGLIEDDEAGVTAGRAAGFGLVIGVNRAGRDKALMAAGADLVVGDLSELLPGGGPPSALLAMNAVETALRGRRPILFLDYDGTVTPIVDRPEDAVLSGPMRTTIATLSKHILVAFISGRMKDEVRGLVGLDNVFYAGSHGYEIEGPGGVSYIQEDGARLRPMMSEAAAHLKTEIGGLPGVLIEDKSFAVAIHYRLVKDDDYAAVETAVQEMGRLYPDLYVAGGKKVFELRPRIDWHKGKALDYLLDALDMTGPDVLPFYIGDDVTDQDAFEALDGKGIAILVSEHPLPTAARFRLRDPAEVQVFLDHLAAALD